MIKNPLKFFFKSIFCGHLDLEVVFFGFIRNYFGRSRFWSLNTTKFCPRCFYLAASGFKNKAGVQPEGEFTGSTGTRVGGMQQRLQWRSDTAAENSAKIHPAFERGVQEHRSVFWDKCDKTRVRTFNLTEETTLNIKCFCVVENYSCVMWNSRSSGITDLCVITLQSHRGQ